MASYLILARPKAPLPDDGSVIVRDSFSWPAFWFSVVWLLVNRLWSHAALALVGLAIALWGMSDPHWAGVGLVLAFCIVLCIGLEGANWRVEALLRLGCRLVDVVEAPDAETGFDMHVADWTETAHAAPADPLAKVRALRAGADQPATIGLVPWQRG